MKKRGQYSSFHHWLFWSVIIVFILLAGSFTAVELINEKRYKIESMNVRLTGYNDYIERELQAGKQIEDIAKNPLFRTTLLTLDGKIFYDTEGGNAEDLENYLDKKEIKQAIKSGKGYDEYRLSEATGNYYFYSAKKYDDYIIRSALPYNEELVESLSISYTYLWIVVGIVLILSFVFYEITKRLGKNINNLSEFAKRADRDEVIEYSLEFPNNELGKISQHIVQIYNRLMQTKQDLEIEKEEVVRQQEEQHRIKRQLTQNIAHELKTPVSSIQGFLETIISNNNLTADQIHNFIEKSYLQSQRLSALLSDMSKLTMIEEAPEMIERINVDLSSIIKEVLSDVEIQLKEKNISVVNTTADQQLMCFGNPMLLYSIFRNLIDNTIAYAGMEIEIYIDCYKKDDMRYYFSYSDNGVGVSDEHLSKIFERFYRLDKGRSRKSGGTGLGLAIVKNALAFHGGSIIAKRCYKGGLEFLFTIAKKKSQI